MVNEYPKEGKATHPDSVGQRRMPPRQTKVAGTDYDMVKYGAKYDEPGGRSYTSQRTTGDLGHALKEIKRIRNEFAPEEQDKIKMHAE